MKFAMKIDAKLLRASLVLLLLAPLAGCFLTPLARDLGKLFGGGDAESGDGAGWEVSNLELPKPGDRLTVADPSTGEPLTVIVREVYTAASGQLCGTYTVDGEPGPRTPGLICLQQRSEWVNVRPVGGRAE